MALNLDNIKRKLEQLSKLQEKVMWKANVVLPEITDTDFDRVKHIMESAVSKFWNTANAISPIEPAQRWFKVAFQGIDGEIEFKIHEMNITTCDWRDATDYKNSKEKNKYIGIRVVLEVESSVKHKRIMLVDHPLEFSLSGRLVRKKKSGELQSIVFDTLKVDNGIDYRSIIEV